MTLLFFCFDFFVLCINRTTSCFLYRLPECLLNVSWLYGALYDAARGTDHYQMRSRSKDLSGFSLAASSHRVSCRQVTSSGKVIPPCPALPGQCCTGTIKVQYLQ
ncbi:hypothetical protein ElyMa_006497600 [Elysia marginata]|uniref:Secreted protein n=1 Tax=Elysia marginata TaxID=1093978 RepID=A0AAV4I2P8_9GAST|nr:hypothetical protein ElyMa_006497600 [Elysia marginata]